MAFMKHIKKSIWMSGMHCNVPALCGSLSGTFSCMNKF